MPATGRRTVAGAAMLSATLLALAAMTAPAAAEKIDPNVPPRP